MADVEVLVTLWGIRPGDISLNPVKHVPGLLRLELTEDVRLMIGGGSVNSAAGEAAALRRLAEVAADAAGKLERQSGKDRRGGNARQRRDSPATGKNKKAEPVPGNQPHHLKGGTP